ncbi:hypothetical protein QFZ82_007445 [Streptomyces sp. V4I23]|uniref:hypothetical protein n=1 Tax=Streptomyces sp. V4I23 TaxID=3042282 RepID=UPI00278812D5|nr:hypothetical protein [Streptomyces sp. V4I23]MDQ1012960.1 hypothetical protein [Streptomyces sp. V4I23]
MAVEDAERQLGVRLPSSLPENLRLQNGGRVAFDWDRFPDRGAEFALADGCKGSKRPKS